jgi:hypothetical protein
VFDVPKSSPQIDMSAPGGSVRLHSYAPPIHLYLVADVGELFCTPQHRADTLHARPQINLFGATG